MFLYILSVHYLSCFTSSYTHTLTQLRVKYPSCLSTSVIMLIFKIIALKTIRNTVNSKVRIEVLLVFPLHWAVWHRMTVSSHFLIQTSLSALCGSRNQKQSKVFSWRNEQAKETQPKTTVPTGSRPTNVRDGKNKSLQHTTEKKQGHICTPRLEGHAMRAVTDTTLKRCGILLSNGQDGLFTRCTTVHVFAG